MSKEQKETLPVTKIAAATIEWLMTDEKRLMVMAQRRTPMTILRFEATHTDFHTMLVKRRYHQQDDSDRESFCRQTKFRP